MGRIADLCGEVAAAADEGPEGLRPLARGLGQAARRVVGRGHRGRARLRQRPVAAESELVEAADNVSARLVELLGTWGEARAWTAAVEGHASISIDVIRQLAHRLDRLEEILEVFRDQKGPDRRGFDALQRRLMDQGIEDEMRPDWEKQGPGEPEEQGGS